MQRKVIFIASSVKKNKRCIAAVDIENGKFLRVVGDKNGKEVDWSEFELIGFKNYKLPFIAEIDILKKVPLNHQPENIIINKKIKFLKNIDIKELEKYVNHPKTLWGEDHYIEYYKNLKIKFSLFLIKVDEIELYWKDRGVFYSKQRRGKFLYNNIVYDLPLTDPKYSDLKEQTLNDRYIVVSLGEPFEVNNSKKCYKIIAKVY